MKPKLIRILLTLSVVIVAFAYFVIKQFFQTPTEKLTEYDYAVTFFSTHTKGKMNVKNKIVFIDETEKQREYEIKGSNVTQLIQDADQFYGFSSKPGKNIVFKTSSGFSQYSIKVPSADASKLAVRQIAKGKNGYIYGFSVEDGSTGVHRGYILYKNEKGEEVLTPKLNVAITGMLEVDSKIFYTGYELVSDKYELLYVNETTNEIELISEDSDFRELLLVNGKVMTVGNPHTSRLEKEDTKEKKVSLKSVNPSTLEVKEIHIDSERILTAYVFQDKLRVITKEGKMLEFTSDLELVVEKEVSSTEFTKLFTTNEVVVQKVQTSADKVVVLTTPKAASTTEMGTLLEFDADTLEFKKSIVIPVSGDEEWKNDYANFIFIEKR